MGDTANEQHGRTSANNLDDGISRLDKTLNKIYLPEIMAARRVIHSRMRKKRERQMAGGPRNGPTLYDYIMESRRRKGGGQSVGMGEQQPLEDVPEGDEKREHQAPTRQDSAFQSVDLSEIAGLREDPNRTPTPQPTFTDGPQQVRQERQTDRTEAVAALATVSEKTPNSRSSSGQSSTKSEELHERYELQVKPGYADAQQVEMATAACRVNDQRRNSYHSTTDRKVNYRQNSASSDPGEVREKSVKKKQQQRQANDLDLAQKIILKRKVEEYIDRQEPETTIDEVAESSTKEAAWAEESEVKEDVVKESTEKTKHHGRESIQTVVSHRSESSSGNSPVTSRDEVSSAISTKSPDGVISENFERPESGTKSRPSMAGSDLNPHPVLPGIGTPPVTDDSGSLQQEESEEDDNFPVAEAVTAGAVAAGAGTAAAVAIKANNSEKTKKEKTKENKKQRKDRKLSAKVAEEASKADKPKVKGPKADAARENAPQKPEKKEKSKEDKKPLSLIDMSPGEMKSTIDALDKMVDANIQDVIDNTKGKKPIKSTDSENDRRMVKAVMNPAFQAEINNFLAQT
ncbi:uncharacterized protein LOC135473937 [Liolophura sinensis]|uniref:uncharacterized protein LOC135473937 n=1 Tax=Liolophura sinensis TaxID=3198878 RepID=UPI0031590A1A